MQLYFSLFFFVLKTSVLRKHDLLLENWCGQVYIYLYGNSFNFAFFISQFVWHFCFDCTYKNIIIQNTVKRNHFFVFCSVASSFF